MLIKKGSLQDVWCVWLVMISWISDILMTRGQTGRRDGHQVLKQVGQMVALTLLIRTIRV